MLNILFLVATLYAVYFYDKVRKSPSTNDGLTQNEKISVILSEIFSPVLAGAIYYYGWRKKFPKKASQANKYSWIIFGLLILLSFAYMSLVGTQ
jgi:hypothetical protein